MAHYDPNWQPIPFWQAWRRRMNSAWIAVGVVGVYPLLASWDVFSRNYADLKVVSAVLVGWLVSETLYTAFDQWNARRHHDPRPGGALVPVVRIAIVVVSFGLAALAILGATIPALACIIIAAVGVVIEVLVTKPWKPGRDTAVLREASDAMEIPTGAEK